MEPVVRVPVVSQVEEKIRELIESKKYTEGMKLPTENELCQSMKVGRGTVREALRLLQAKGLVEIKPGRGAFVAEDKTVDTNPVVWLVQNERELRNAIEVRNALEPCAARKMAETASEASMNQLKKIHSDFLSAVKNGNSEQIAALDEQFHGLIVKESGNQLLHEINVHVLQGMHTFRNKTFTVPENVRNAVEPHTRILNAITGRDGNAAEREMRKHLKMVDEDLSSSIKAYMHIE